MSDKSVYMIIVVYIVALFFLLKLGDDEGHHRFLQKERKKDGGIPERSVRQLPTATFVKKAIPIKSAASEALRFSQKKNNRISLLFISQDRVRKESLKFSSKTFSQHGLDE